MLPSPISAPVVPAVREAADILREISALVLPPLKAAVELLPPSMRRIAGYQFGWNDENGLPVDVTSGKLVRPALALLCARAVGAPAEKALPAAVAVELIHNFTLVHDDVMDGDLLRRHRCTAWSVFGIADAVLLGDSLLVLAYQILADGGRGSSVALAEALQETVQGQSMDMAFEKCCGVTVDEGLAMATGKTGALLGCACRLGALSAGAEEQQARHFADFGRAIGLAFQLADDLLGIWGDPAVTGKPVHSDLRARKKSLPVLAALSSCTAAADRLLDLYNTEQPFGLDECSLAADLIEEAGGRAWTEQRALQAHQEAVTALSRALPQADAAADLLVLTSALNRRQY